MRGRKKAEAAQKIKLIYEIYAFKMAKARSEVGKSGLAMKSCARLIMCMLPGHAFFCI